MKKVLILALLGLGGLKGTSSTPPLLSVGGGYWDARSKHSGWLIEFEYKAGRCFWGHFRPQAALILPQCQAFFIGAGIGLEIYIKETWIFTPNFMPGLYANWSNRDLGFPLEFRSGVDIAYEFENGMRLGGQFYHISNASLGDRNPGANATTLFVSFPLSCSFF